MQKKLTIVALLIAMSTGIQAAPLDDFKVIVAKCRESLADRANPEVLYQSNKQDWMKIVTGPSKVTFDVRKTDSLVTPFSGKIEIALSVATGRASSEAAATALDLAPGKKGAYLRIKTISFSYFEDGNKWEATRAMSRSSEQLTDSGEMGSEFVFSTDRDGILKYREPTKACNNLQ